MERSSRLRVLIVVPDSLHGKGGIERLMLYLSRALPVVEPNLQLDVHATRWTTAPILNHLTTPLSLVAFFLRCLFGGYDVVHINVGPKGSTFRKMLFTRAAQIAGRRVILHLHGSGYDAFFARLKPRVQQSVVRFFQSADHVVVLGQFWNAFAQSTLGVAPNRLSVIDNGVPTPAQTASPGKTPATLVFMGLVGQRKGVDVLLQALAALPADLPAWRVVIGGNGEIETYQTRAKTLGLETVVQFAGWMEEDAVDALLCESDLFVLPSRAENQPVSILEAMARGLPVVSTRIGAIPEQVAEGETGLLVEPGDSGALSQALAALIASPEQRVKMGANARARFQALFSVERTAELFLRLYCNEADDIP